MSDLLLPKLHFGGPDRPARELRNILFERTDAVPEGGEILWSTYYFRDVALADALIAASDRGVRVTLHVEGCPRRPDVNRAVLERLRRHGLKGGLNVHEPLFASWMHGHLHSKIYIFSDPTPTALIGSFNPSGNIPEDQAIIAEIGDQDRGHNLLVEYNEPGFVETLRDHVLSMGARGARFRPSQNRPRTMQQETIWFYPRLRTDIVAKHLRKLEKGSAVRGAISHLKRGALTKELLQIAHSGGKVDLLVHDTERRVPEKLVSELSGGGVQVSRYRHPNRLPLHAKFLLIEDSKTRLAFFGSFNYNLKSAYFNREILVASKDPSLFALLNGRFDFISCER